MPLRSYSGSTAKTRTSPVSPSQLQKPTRAESCEQTQPFIRPSATPAATASEVIPTSASRSLDIGFSLVRARTKKSSSTSDGSVSRNTNGTVPPFPHPRFVVVSRPREFHPQPLAELYVTLSRHTAPGIETPDLKVCQWTNNDGR